MAPPPTMPRARLLLKELYFKDRAPWLVNKAPPFSEDQQSENVECRIVRDEKLRGNGRLSKTSAQIAPPEPPNDRHLVNQEADTDSMEP